MKKGALLPIIAVAGGLLLVSAQSRKKAEREAQARALAEAEEKKRLGEVARSNKATIDLAAQVRQFQTLMGLSPDGVIGPKTIAAAISLGLTRLDASTILKAISLATLKKNTAQSSSDRVTRAKQILAAMTNSRPAKLRINTKSEAMYLDLSKSQFVPTGGIFVIPQGTSFYPSEIKNRPASTGYFIVEMPVYKVGSEGETYKRLVRFGPENIYV